MRARSTSASLRGVPLRALLLLLLTLAVCWPQWHQAELDGTEGRRVQIAQEMARSGDWLVPTLGGQPTWAKPPLHYWILAAIERWCGTGVLWWRLPSVLAVFASALLAGELLRRWFGAQVGWIGALGVACSPLVLFSWPTAEIDPLFATLTAASLWCLASGVASERRWVLAAAGALGGLALLQKGPPFLLFATGACLVWWRHCRLRGVLWFVLPMVAAVAAYYGPLLLWRVQPAAMLAVAGDESVGRLAYYEWKHVRTLPEFWLRAIAVQLPFALWCLWEWRGARDARMSPTDLLLRMCSGAAVVAVALLSLFPGRATRYLLPNVLLFTFAVTPAVAHFARWPGPVPPLARTLCRIVGVLGALALIGIPFVPGAGVASLGLAAVAALAPLLTTPARIVAFCLILPVVAAWTVGLERSRDFDEGPRARGHAAQVLREAVERLGVEPGQLRTIGHFDSALHLATGWLLPGDERAAPPWTGRWVLHECIGEVHPPANYVLRLRLDLPFKSFALRERVGG